MQQLFQGHSLFGVLNLGQQSNQYHSSVQTMKIQQQQVSEQKSQKNTLNHHIHLRACYEFSKMLKINYKFDEISELLKNIQKTENLNMQKFMKIWIILEKFSLLETAKKQYKKYLSKKQENQEKKDFQRYALMKKWQQNMLASLNEQDLKSAIQVYWGEQKNHRYKKQGMAQLNAFRKKLRSKKNNLN